MESAEDKIARLERELSALAALTQQCMTKLDETAHRLHRLCHRSERRGDVHHHRLAVLETRMTRDEREEAEAKVAAHEEKMKALDEQMTLDYLRSEAKRANCDGNA